MEGTHITAGVLCMSPTSLGVLTLASSKANDDPIIDPDYFTLEHDRVVIRAGMRRALQAMESSALRIFTKGEAAPPVMPSINYASTDTELENCIQCYVLIKA